MKKKIGIFVGIIIIIFLVIYGIVFYTDYSKVQNGELPVFASKQDNENYKGLGYNISITYYKDTDNIETMNMYMFKKVVAGIVIDYVEE